MFVRCFKRASFSSSSPTPTINWFKRGGDLPKQKVKFVNYNKTLHILNVSEEDSGSYTCMASNKMGSLRHSVDVQVKGKPVRNVLLRILQFFGLISMFCLLPCLAAPFWLDKPTNLVLAPDENGRLVCRANGNPKPTIQWQMNGGPIDGKSLYIFVLVWYSSSIKQ